MNPIFLGTSLRGAISLRACALIAGAATLALLAWKSASTEPPSAPAHHEAKPSFPTRLPPEEISAAEALREATPVASTFRRDVERPKPVHDVSEDTAASPPVPTEAPGSPPNRRRDEKKSLPEIFRMPGEAPQETPTSAAPAASPPPAESPDAPFAPFGRLIKCELVAAVDSVTARSAPIVALVTEDLCWNGAVVVPAGSEALGYARPEAVRDEAGRGRLVDEGEWTIVLPASNDAVNGRELVLRARALDRSDAGRPAAGIAPSEGADGLLGEVLSTQGDREIKLFAAAALGGWVQGATAVAERQQPAPGLSGVLGATQVAPTLGNLLTASAGSASSELLAPYASRIRDEITRRGLYVRVPAGKRFFLFVEQTIRPEDARVGMRHAPNPGPKA